MSRGKALVGVIMGSKNDWDVMRDAVDELKRLGIPYEVRVVSAHRTPELMFEYAKTAVDRGLEVIIAGAGGAAHLPGMTASLTPLPVIGVPIMTKQLNGIDSLLSIVQMPYGTPVATVAINGARNAALLAARILGIKYPEFRQRVVELMDSMRNEVMRTVLEDA
jgi:5-(carboxyamino)imidazole ribonucleotide mutase